MVMVMVELVVGLLMIVNGEIKEQINIINRYFIYHSFYFYNISYEFVFSKSNEIYF